MSITVTDIRITDGMNSEELAAYHQQLALAVLSNVRQWTHDEAFHAGVMAGRQVNIGGAFLDRNEIDRLCNESWTRLNV